MNELTRLIKLDESTPLPCAIYNPQTGEPCGKDATVAWAYEELGQMPPSPVRWVLQPICRDCAGRTAKVYGIV